MTTRKIPPATRQARAYSPDDPRYERNARLKALEAKAAEAAAVEAATPPPVVETTTVQADPNVDVSIGGALVGTQPGIDFVAGPGVELTGSNIAPQGRVSITVNAQTTVVNLTITGDQDDYSVTGSDTASILRLTPTESLRISGLADGVDGRTIKVVNASADYTILLTREDTDSVAANRFTWSHPNPVFLMPGDTVTLLYDATSALWRLMDNATASLQAQLPTFTDCNAGAGDDYSLTYSGTAAAGASGNYLVDGTGKAHGVFQLSTGTDADGRSFLACGDAESLSPALGPALFVTRVAVEDLSDGTDMFQVFAGFMDAQSSTDVSNGCYWYYSFS